MGVFDGREGQEIDYSNAHYIFFPEVRRNRNISSLVNENFCFSSCPLSKHMYQHKNGHMDKT